MSGEFAPEQKRYLEGFVSGLQAARAARGLQTGNGAAAIPGSGGAEPVGPEAAAIKAQDRFVGAGQKLSDPEKFKRELHPFDGYERLKAQAAANEAPKPPDNFRWRFYGLFYVAPAQNAYMCRLRIPNGILKHWQFAGVADLAERYGGGYAHVTTRANLQIREIEPKNAIAMIEAIQDLGLCSRGSGADNIRNVTGTPTAGIDPQELIDTRSLTRELYHYILNHRELYGLPRKFNIAFDGGSRIAMLEDTADIGFAAVKVDQGRAVPPGVYFRMLLGGLTGHGGFARDSGVLLLPSEVVQAANAIIRLFIAHSDRTDRKRARLHYLVEGWGIEKCLAEAAGHLPFPWRFLPVNACEPRGAIERQGHIGIHPQAQPGLFYAGVVLPAGRLRAAQLLGLADIAERFGSGTLRLTVWQNLLISDIAEAQLPEAIAAIEGLGLGTSASVIRGGMVACTGNVGCKFALSDTKRHGLDLVDYLDGGSPSTSRSTSI
jgi:ferredoxin-nitrite reductase